MRADAARWKDQLSYATGSATEEVDHDAMLVRPDGVVAWIGSRADGDQLAAALSRWLGDVPREQSAAAQVAE